MDKSLIDQLLAEYKKFTNCAGINGGESLEELARIFIEKGDRFCEKTNFPSLDVWREFKRYDTQRLGFYIDAGRVEFANKEVIVLVGETTADLYYDELKAHKVILMHGARANITAEKWGLVFVTAGAGCKVIEHVSDNARVL